MPRTIIELDRSASILDVAERITASDLAQDIVAVGAAGAPWLRNAVFLDVAKRLAEPRRFALVTSDQRARSLAASMHVPAYSSVGALDRHELDATERLVHRRAAPVPGRASRLRPPAITRRGLAVMGSLTAAVLLVLAVVVPEATVVVAPTTRALGPLELQVRAGPGEIERVVLSETLTAKVQGTATGSREELVKAKGSVVLSNRQTQSRSIANGTVFRTSDSISFASTEEKTLPASIIFGPVPLTVGTVEVPVEAVVAGRAGNVAAGRITTSPAPNDYLVNNPQPTTGGDAKKIPIVQRQDHATATSSAKLDPAVRDRAEARLAEWRTRPPSNMYVVARVYTTITSVTPEAAVVGKEVEVFDLTVSFVATAFAVPIDEPRKTALARLNAMATQGYTLPESSIQYQETLLDDETGGGVVAWSIRIAGSEIARVDRDGIRRSLAGRALGEIDGVLERAGVRLVRAEREPPWWPRFPVLEGRIRVSEIPATASR